MATKKPLVLGGDGRIQQLQAGDTLGMTSETGQVTQTADAALLAGNVVYQSAADHVNKARANALGTSDAVGFAVAAVSNGAAGVIQQNGVLALTTSEWDAVAGTTGGLTYNTRYFLDPATAGKITATCPTTVGQYRLPCGIALSTTELKIEFGELILL